MGKRLTGTNPLAYTGVEPLTPPNSIQARKNPEPTDAKGFNIGDMWINVATDQIWVLASFNMAGAVWVEVASGAGAGAENFITDGGTAVVDATNINIKGGALITTDALTPHQVTVSLDNGTDGQIIIGATAGSPAYANLTSDGGTITITNGANSINIEADTTGFLSSIETDGGTATAEDGVIVVGGDGNIFTTGSGNTVIAHLLNGSDGQLLIGGGGTAQWENLTSTGGSISITNGANSINLEALTTGTNTFTTNAGVATQLSNNINVIGLGVVQTLGSSDNVEIRIPNPSSPNGKLIIGGGADPDWANLTSTGGSITITNGANSINLEATAATTFDSDSGSATPSLGILNIFGGPNISTDASGNTLNVNLTNGTDGQLLIGGGSQAQWMNLTSLGSTITITNGPNSINLESTTDGTNTFVTDSGTATQSLNSINILGSGVINTAGASSTVTLGITNGTDGQLLIGGGSNAAWANLTSVGASVVITNGPNSINLEATGTGAGASAFVTNSGTANESGGSINILGANVVTTTGSGSTVTVAIPNPGTPNGKLLIGGGANPAWANLTSTGATVVITNGANSINLEAIGGGGGGTVTFNTDSGAATESGGAITIAGGTNINTTGSGSTVTVKTVNSPSFSGSVTAGTGVTVTTGGLTVSSGGITATGTIRFSSLTNGVLIGGGTGTVSASNGTNGQLLIGGGSVPAWRSVTSTDGSVTITTGTNSLNLASNATYHTNGSNAVGANGQVTFAGTSLISTNGSGSTVTTRLTNGTSGQVIIGGGSAPAWATLTSSGGTIVFTPGVNSLNLEATTGGSPGASTFNTDSGTATQSAGAITIAGGTNISTSGSGSTVTVRTINSPSFSGNVTVGNGLNVLSNGIAVTSGGIVISADGLMSTGATQFTSLSAGVMQTNASGDVSSTNGSNGQLLIGGGTAPTWANLTSTDGSITITNTANHINLAAGGGGGASKITTFTSSGTWTKAAGTNMVSVIGWHGGGGGASGGTGSAGNGGGGGAQGSVFYFTVPAVFCGATEVVTVGAGGTGGASQSSLNQPGFDGNDGTPSSFGKLSMPQLLSGGYASAINAIGTAYAGGQAGYLYDDNNALFTGASNGPIGVAIPGGNATSTTIPSQGGGAGGPVGSPGTNAPNIGGTALSTYLRYKVLLGTGGGGGGSTGGTGGAFIGFNGSTVIYAGAAAGANGMNQPTSGGIPIGGLGGGGGSANQKGGNGGFPGGGAGGGGPGVAGNPSGAGGKGGNGYVIVIEW